MVSNHAIVTDNRWPKKRYARAKPWCARARTKLRVEVFLGYFATREEAEDVVKAYYAR